MTQEAVTTIITFEDADTGKFHALLAVSDPRLRIDKEGAFFGVPALAKDGSFNALPLDKKIGFIGGYVDQGEIPHGAALREIGEECGKAFADLVRNEAVISPAYTMSRTSGQNNMPLTIHYLHADLGKRKFHEIANMIVPGDDVLAVGIIDMDRVARHENGYGIEGGFTHLAFAKEYCPMDYSSWHEHTSEVSRDIFALYNQHGPANAMVGLDRDSLNKQHISMYTPMDWNHRFLCDPAAHAPAVTDGNSGPPCPDGAILVDLIKPKLLPPHSIALSHDDVAHLFTSNVKPDPESMWVMIHIPPITASDTFLPHPDIDDHGNPSGITEIGQNEGKNVAIFRNPKDSLDGRHSNQKLPIDGSGVLMLPVKKDHDFGNQLLTLGKTFSHAPTLESLDHLLKELRNTYVQHGKVPDIYNSDNSQYSKMDFRAGSDHENGMYSKKPMDLGLLVVKAPTDNTELAFTSNGAFIHGGAQYGKGQIVLIYDYPRHEIRKMAPDYAIENFVFLDGSPLTLEQLPTVELSDSVQRKSLSQADINIPALQQQGTLCLGGSQHVFSPSPSRRLS